MYRLWSSSSNLGSFLPRILLVVRRLTKPATPIFGFVFRNKLLRVDRRSRKSQGTEFGRSPFFICTSPPNCVAPTVPRQPRFPILTHHLRWETSLPRSVAIFPLDLFLKQWPPWGFRRESVPCSLVASNERRTCSIREVFHTLLRRSEDWSWWDRIDASKVACSSPTMGIRFERGEIRTS